ncbi:MAG: methionine synthase, partial [Verrucomicrobiales bacterium]|nr:methionine synthase [Verrucomicrobiales bacterium]
GPPAHDQRGKHAVVAPLRAPRGLGAVEEFRRLQRLAAVHAGEGVTLKASVPGPYTLSGRLLPNPALGYPDRWALAEALLPFVRTELEALVAAGCREISVDEPSMSCYAQREDTRRFVDLFNRTTSSIVGRTRVCTHLCFGNYKARAVGPRLIAPMFPAFLDFTCDEMHVEMASREFAELEMIRVIAQRFDVAVGIVDVKSYYIESPEDIARRVKRCLEFAPAERLAFAPDCGLSQTARWASRRKLASLVAGVKAVRKELGLANA